MNDTNKELNFEKNYLAKVISVAKNQLKDLKLDLGNIEENILSIKKEQQENTRNSIQNLWSRDNFYELAALSQYVGQVSSQINEYETDANSINKLENIIDNPYFARIDFKFEDEDDFEKIYIGKSSLREDYQMYVYDWRSPIASVFYRFGSGEAFYQAPNGEIRGELGLKRQFEIINGKLNYFFDSDLQIIDEFLRKILSQNTSVKMKTIVETIQKDQDVIIRDMENDLLMVQGVAGSGKTSVALHRVAYLMYKGLSNKLNAENIIVISPNKLFENYISNVLPELTERSVLTTSFEDIFKNILNSKNINSKNQYFEKIITSNKTEKNLLKGELKFKTSNIFKTILDRFISDLPNKYIEFEDIYYNQKIISSKNLMKNEILSTKDNSPLGVKLKKLETKLLEKIHEERKERILKLKNFANSSKNYPFDVDSNTRMLSIWESTNLINKIHGFTEIDPIYLYKKLFSDPLYFCKLSKGLDLPKNINEIFEITQKNCNLDTITYADSAAITYLHLKLFGSRDFKLIKQIVVDEVQDYYPLHFEILHLLFPNSKYTLLGDVNQTIEKNEKLSIYNEVKTILKKEKALLSIMNKSFRCTDEIIKFSQKFLDDDSILSVGRKGEPPEIISVSDRKELSEKLIKEININLEKGYKTIGLLCKSQKESQKIYDTLKKSVEIKLIDDNSFDFDNVFVIPIYLSKGLEFDSVIICDCSDKNYNTSDDKHTLYVASSRALHRLSVFYTGKKSRLLV